MIKLWIDTKEAIGDIESIIYHKLKNFIDCYEKIDYDSNNSMRDAADAFYSIVNG